MWVLEDVLKKLMNGESSHNLGQANLIYYRKQSGGKVLDLHHVIVSVYLNINNPGTNLEIKHNSSGL
jgi:hypothetical protein